ncbi:MAG: alpha/beta fold hydrolase [Planctomycetota bacterium]|nr:MAG: alpha/beta fold hydrolase [Planctomycetota bacterium]REJ88803.1 MAG: alpha/beta fold hydrolase [Planctomycetota bacterium]REK29493.1 MAG: alpha/beta fold hydrolase [Planctomycetota bacterium]REK31858.1 MAG: alpha/beta fold hydrolase [Planctomycetota bacterium]
MKEECVQFGTAGSIGIVTTPEDFAADAQHPAVILLNAGLVHRVGPNRLYVKCARRLAELGYVVLRFDFSGCGDTPPRSDHRPLEESVLDETQQAMDLLHQRWNVRQFVLGGLCSGAVHALRTADIDRRVGGLLLLNPRSSNTQSDSYAMGKAALQKYSKLARTSPARFLRTVRRKIGISEVTRVVHSMLCDLGLRRSTARLDPDVESEASVCGRLIGRGMPLLFVFSEHEPGRESYRALLEADASRQSGSLLTIEFIKDADHTLTLLEHQRQLLECVTVWLEDVARFENRVQPAVADMTGG